MKVDSNIDRNTTVYSNKVKNNMNIVITNSKIREFVSPKLKST